MPNARAAEWLSKLIAWVATSDYETLGFSDDLVTLHTYMFQIMATPRHIRNGDFHLLVRLVP
jgi:hypothetical protein